MYLLEPEGGITVQSLWKFNVLLVINRQILLRLVHVCIPIKLGFSQLNIAVFNHVQHFISLPSSIFNLIYLLIIPFIK